MKALSLVALVFCATLFSANWSTTIAADLPRSTPEAQGVSSQGVLDFIEAANKSIDSLHSFMLVRHGQVVAEAWWAPYNAESPHMLYSLSKSFTSTAVGMAIAEGKLKLDDELVKLFPDDAPMNPSNNLKSMRISDLLRMNTGQQTEPSFKPDQPWTKTFMSHTVPFKPGTHFQYNTPATYMLSASVQKATGQNLLDYLQPRLFEPLGIKNPTWEQSPQGIATGGYGLSVRTEDIAKFGQLYLQKGKWDGKQLLPAAWVEQATARQTSNGSNPKSDCDQGYGYQFWRCRNNAYRGDGAFGQYCIVLPDQDAVIAITSGVKNMQAVLDLVWDKLLPAMGPNASSANPVTTAKLTQTMKALCIPKPVGTSKPASVAGQKFVFSSNNMKLESLKLETVPKAGTTALLTTIDGKENRIVFGNGTWNSGKVTWSRFNNQVAANCGAWTADDTFTGRICLYETPYVITIRLQFKPGEVRCETESNVGFGAMKEAALIGKAE